MESSKQKFPKRRRRKQVEKKKSKREKDGYIRCLPEVFGEIVDNYGADS